MTKKIVRLTESELKDIVKDTLKNVLYKKTKANVGSKIGNGIDISKIDIETLKQAYRDLRLTPTPVSYNDNSSFPVTIKEAYGDILPPDEVVDKISKKYNFNNELVRKIEFNHKIAVYIVVAAIGKNVELIEADMEKMGYFLGYTSELFEVQGMKFVQLQFEPTSQMQIDETENIKSMYDTLYHWTPEYNLNGILSNGLIPTHKNKMFNYPPRTYLIEGDCDDREILSLGQRLCLMNRNQKNNGLYVLLGINIKDIDENVRFYYDPNSAIGIYTEQVIPNNRIKEINRLQFPKTLR